MTKPYDTRLIMMVAQEPFLAGEYQNQFCKLIPVAYVDGEIPDPADFPNDGEIWWMLTVQSAMLAQPGRLIVGQIEDAQRYEQFNPESSQYQVKLHSVQEVDARIGVQVVELPGAAIDSIQQLVEGKFRVEAKARPTAAVWVRWRGMVSGPFSVTADQKSSVTPSGSYSLQPLDQTGLAVFELEEREFDSAVAQYRIAISHEVSGNSTRRIQTSKLNRVKCDFVLNEGIERVLQTGPSKRVLEPLNRRLLQYARQLLSRAKRQQLSSLLSELDQLGKEQPDYENLAVSIRQASGMADSHSAALSAVAEALLHSGLIGKPLEETAKAYAQRWVEDRTAELQAKAEAAAKDYKRRVDQMELDLKNLESNYQVERAKRISSLEADLIEMRSQALRSVENERAEIEQKKAELERQEGVLKNNLAQVTHELRSAGDRVVNQFLTIAPLLGVFKSETTGTSARTDDSVSKNDSEGSFELPAYVRALGPLGVPATQLSEEAFVSRFRDLVKRSGFEYRTNDLLRFHLSVKCGDLTVLGGPSGTGKSSLPILYGRALLGESIHDRPGCLMVNVNPSWMDSRDLLGHVNTLERRFYPSETGLFHRLVCSTEEFRIVKERSGIQIACLDEMNLAQVEHYFGDLMLVLERTGDERSIQCFAPEAVRPDSKIQSWARIPVSPAIRFVGTVNFDETTRSLSDRFFDRINLIRLSSVALPGTGSPPDLAHATGPLVTVADFDRWRSDKALPTALGGLLDEMRPILAELGCPLSARTYRAICRFVASAEGLLAVEAAFDYQVAQRILPRLRTLASRRQIDAADRLDRLMQSGRAPFEESKPLLQDLREGVSRDLWSIDD
jgi:hypothetical protein